MTRWRCSSDTPQGLGSSGASSSGGAHPAADALPTLDDAILQAVRKLGRLPAEMKKPKSQAEKDEVKLALRIRRHWEKLRSDTISELSALEKRDQYSWIAEIKALEEQMPEYSAPEVMVDAWKILMHRLRFMSQSPISRDVLMAYAKPQTEWWQKAGIVERPKIPAWCPNGGKHGRTDVKVMHYDLCVVLYADAKAFLAALAEYDRIRKAEDRELYGITNEDSWEEIKRKHHEGWAPARAQRPDPA